MVGSDTLPQLGSESPHPEMKIGMASVRVSAESRRLNIAIIPDREEYLPGEEVTLGLRVTTPDGAPVGMPISRFLLWMNRYWHSKHERMKIHLRFLCSS